VSPKLLDYYQALETASEDMLKAAQAGDWNQVYELESVCLVLINQLKGAFRSQSLDPEEVATKKLMMRRILENDAAMRDLTKPDFGLMAPGTPTLH